MNLPFFLLIIVALDCIGFISNIRMLFRLLSCCFRKENKYRYLVPWMTCQFVYQIVFLVTVTMYAWNIYIDDNYEYCCTLRRLKETVEILELLNLFHLWCLQFWGAKLNKRFADWYSYTDNIDGVAWYGNHELRNPVLAPSRVKSRYCEPGDLLLVDLQRSRPKVSLFLFRT